MNVEMYVNGFGCLQGHLVACLTAMLKLMDEAQYRLLVDAYSDRRPLKVGSANKSWFVAAF